MRTTLEIYTEIIQSAVFRLSGKRIDLCGALIELCNAINAEEETDWYMGGGEEACLSDLIPGAFWAMTECHAGQSSDSYAALCALGSIFSPGMSSTPTEDEPEYGAYYLCCKYLTPGCMVEKEGEG